MKKTVQLTQEWFNHLTQLARDNDLEQFVLILAKDDGEFITPYEFIMDEKFVKETTTGSIKLNDEAIKEFLSTLDKNDTFHYLDTVIYLHTHPGGREQLSTEEEGLSQILLLNKKDQGDWLSKNDKSYARYTKLDLINFNFKVLEAAATPENIGFFDGFLRFKRLNLEVEGNVIEAGAKITLKGILKVLPHIWKKVSDEHDFKLAAKERIKRHAKDEYDRQMLKENGFMDAEIKY